MLWAPSQIYKVPSSARYVCVDCVCVGGAAGAPVGWAISSPSTFSFSSVLAMTKMLEGSGEEKRIGSTPNLNF